MPAKALPRHHEKVVGALYVILILTMFSPPRTAIVVLFTAIGRQFYQALKPLKLGLIT